MNNIYYYNRCTRRVTHSALTVYYIYIIYIYQYPELYMRAASSGGSATQRMRPPKPLNPRQLTACSRHRAPLLLRHPTAP